MNKIPIIKTFSPAWFAAVMGTGVIPLALSFINIPLSKIFGQFFIILALVMFTLIIVPWLLKVILHFDEARETLKHPIATNFYPTMPISLLILSLDFIKYPSLFGEELSHILAHIFWALGTLGIYFFGHLIMLTIFKHKEIQQTHANFSWYIPPVSLLLIPVAGLDLILNPLWAKEIYFLISFVSLGTGFFLFLFIGSIVLNRYIYHQIPPAKMASTFFIGIAPSAILSIIFSKLITALPALGPILQEDLLPLKGIFKLFMLACWGFSFWWFILGVLLLIHYIRIDKFPFALSWWAFTFPVGALSVSSGIIMKSIHHPLTTITFYTPLIFLLIFWLIVFINTLRGINSRQIFIPSH